MPLELIAQGDRLADIPDAEALLPEGVRAELRLYMSETVPSWILSGLNLALEVAGVPLRQEVQQEAGIISIKWTKGFAWLPLIVAAIMGLVILVSLFLAWQLFQEISEAVIPIGLLILLGAGAYLLATSKRDGRRNVVRRRS